MPLVLARVDDRLIHGQVVVGWVRHLRADCILVANDAIADDPLQRALLPLAVPPEIQVEIFHVSELPLQLSSGAWAEKRVLLLFSSLVDVLRYVRRGGHLPELNIGGIRFAPGKTQVQDAVSLGKDDVAALRELALRRLRMLVQMVPTDAPFDILKVIPEGGA